VIIKGLASIAKFCVFVFGNIRFLLLGFVCSCLDFHCPICVSVGCNNGAVFRVVRYVFSWVFRLDRLSWSRMLVVQNLLYSYWLQMLQFNGQDYSFLLNPSKHNTNEICTSITTFNGALQSAFLPDRTYHT
jgi:hypothetical protein